MVKKVHFLFYYYTQLRVVKLLLTLLIIKLQNFQR